jgi:hypothetical protein
MLVCPKYNALVKEYVVSKTLTNRMMIIIIADINAVYRDQKIATNKHK